MSDTNAKKRTLLLTGASRGIGHATVKRFSSAGWRVITCSRHGFPENCPWEMGPEDHIQVDLADRGHHEPTGGGAPAASHVEIAQHLGASRGDHGSTARLPAGNVFSNAP